MRGVRGRKGELSFSGAGPVSDKCSSNYTMSVLSFPFSLSSLPLILPVLSTF